MSTLLVVTSEINLGCIGYGAVAGSSGVNWTGVISGWTCFFLWGKCHSVLL